MRTSGRRDWSETTGTPKGDKPPGVRARRNGGRPDDGLEPPGLGATHQGNTRNASSREPGDDRVATIDRMRFRCHRDWDNVCGEPRGGELPSVRIRHSWGRSVEGLKPHEIGAIHVEVCGTLPPTGPGTTQWRPAVRGPQATEMRGAKSEERMGKHATESPDATQWRPTGYGPQATEIGATPHGRQRKQTAASPGTAHWRAVGRCPRATGVGATRQDRHRNNGDRESGRGTVCSTGRGLRATEVGATPTKEHGRPRTHTAQWRSRPGGVPTEQFRWFGKNALDPPRTARNIHGE